MGAAGSDYKRLRKALRDLEHAGSVVRLPHNRYALAGTGRQDVEGTITFTRSGRAFVSVPGAGRDVLIPDDELGGALEGDRVRVHLDLDLDEARPRGRVVDVLERARLPVVGILRQERRGARVEVLSRTGARDIHLLTDADVGTAAHGDVVVVEITTFGTRSAPPLGRITQVLGAAADASTDTASVLHQFGLVEAFPEDVEAEARAAADGQRADPDREDATNLDVWVVDPADARDHDDALSVRDLGGGKFEVGVHIADVSWYVQPGTALDREAFARACSVYLVDRAVPMLPDILSGDTCSLAGPDPSRAVSLFLVIDDRGEVHEHRIARTWIQPRPALSYEEAQARIDAPPDPAQPVVSALHTLSRLAEILRASRHRRGSLDFDLPEAQVELGSDGQPLAIRPRERLEAHRMIEEWMLLANERIARDCVRHGRPVLYRTHAAPDAERLGDVEELLRAFGHAVPKNWTPRALQKVLDGTRDQPEEPLIHQAILRAMMRAEYQPRPERHFGLAVKPYAHFTSPIRRYPDLLLHRALLEPTPVDEERVLPDASVTWDEVAAQVNARERIADEAARESIALAQMRFLGQRVGDVFDGVVERVVPFGFFVRPDHVFASGLVHVRTLDGYYFMNERGALVSDGAGDRFRVGDRVRVQLARVDRGERKIDFELVSRHPREPGAA